MNRIVAAIIIWLSFIAIVTWITPAQAGNSWDSSEEYAVVRAINDNDARIKYLEKTNYSLRIVIRDLEDIGIAVFSNDSSIIELQNEVKSLKELVDILLEENK